MQRIALTIIAAALGVSPAFAACLPGAAKCPIDVEMARGADTITLAGRLTQNRDCCAYAMRVRAGQTLTWRVHGPAIRTTIVYPNGDADGPGLASAIPLPQSGTYVFSVRPNLMADGAFGPFTVTFTIR
jgi:hypothetical protein